MLPHASENIEPHAQPRRPIGIVDALLLTLIVALYLFAGWFRSRGRIFWGDEIMGWLVIRQDTWAHLMKVWSDGIDSSGVFFYVFGRPWLGLLGANELSLRLFSAAGMALCFVFTWLAARRSIRIEIVAAVLPIIFFLNRTALWQLANGRAYGVLMAAVGLSAYAFLKTSPEEPGANGAWPMTLVGLSLLLLTGSHILGVLFWGFLFAAFCMRDLCFRVFRPKLYLVALLGLLVLPISRRNIASTAALGKPSFWTIPPGLHDLIKGFGDYSRITDLLIFATVLLFVALFFVRHRQTPIAIVPRSKISLYVLIVSLFALVPCMWLISHLATPIFVDRYLLPVMVADALLVCELCDRIAAMLHFAPRVYLATAVIALLAFAGIYRADLRFNAPLPVPDYTPALLAAIPSGEPVVITAIGDFVEMVYYRNRDRVILTPIDWPIQLDPAFGPGGASGLHEMENWKMDGFYADQIQPTAQILAGNRRFVVVSNDLHTLWFQRRIAANPDYQTTELASFPTPDGSLHIWQVETVTPRGSAAKPLSQQELP